MSIEKGTLAELNVKLGDVVECVELVGGQPYKGNNPHYVRDGKYGVAAYDDNDDSTLFFPIKGQTIFRIVSRASDTPTPWKDMTDAEKGALLLAWHRGEAIECWDSLTDEWQTLAENRIKWHDSNPYRVKPSPVVETVTMYTGKPAIRSHFGWTADDWGKGRTHRITFDTVDGVPDCSTVKMEPIE